jgi:hypothetical protein
MPSLYAEITINAPRFAVWDALVRKEEWHRWNTFLFDCDPNLPIRQGAELFLALRRVEGEDETEFQPKVILLQNNRCLRWIAKVPGFRSEHIFQLEDVGPNRTKYIHQERISGLFSRVFLPFIRKEEKEGLRRMSRQIKRYVEYYYQKQW